MSIRHVVRRERVERLKTALLVGELNARFNVADDVIPIRRWQPGDWALVTHTGGTTSFGAWFRSVPSEVPVETSLWWLLRGLADE